LQKMHAGPIVDALEDHKIFLRAPVICILFSSYKN